MNNLVNDFLGTGWKFPIEFSLDTASVVLVNGEESIKNSLDVLFTTPMGERLMHADYGSGLHSFVFEEVNRSTITYMQVVISDAILFNEPRIILNAIDIDTSPNDHAFLEIKIDYTISSTNNRYNYVYPFYFREATNLFK
jgi:phage baseplate assembly protein W